MIYLRTRSQGGLICVASLSLRDCAFQAFAVLAYISPIIHDITENKLVRGVVEEILSDIGAECISSTCREHERWGRNSLFVQ